MEMIQYTSPVSWDDKGMDWESPDPGNLDYYRAIWEAVIERASLVRQSPNEALHSMMKYRPWSVAAMNAIRESIYTLAPYFVNMEFDGTGQRGRMPDLRASGRWKPHIGMGEVAQSDQKYAQQADGHQFHRCVRRGFQPVWRCTRSPV